ncbi:RuBisCO large subunit C-terminal-like domain-containing protein [Rhodohalobacter mucosus]|uniref:Ribulose bisphosphate carboxylase large subunit C-terminal domain-containing protein n=1 Tax=Rhodohalobacter mucosus TaxID=2079485 RepID=A0A316TZ96_9BACT|nr:RuBisCO large subunit C-terminal-like domain-containing protein [Rhodohalobacter mucosus]PWN05356.1 hypothetical protein DDZ15_14915 [Rhodohalobacter mucosus]
MATVEPESKLFHATYRFTADDIGAAEQIADSICLEQSVEMPRDAVPDHVSSSIAQLLSLFPSSDNLWSATIGYPLHLFDDDPTQFLNVIFGNISLQPGIQLIDLEKDKLHGVLPGPSFGIQGIRELSGVSDRPLSCTALKPVGLSPDELALRAEQFAAGGLDIIKDDHGLADQQSAPFSARVKACVSAIEKGMQKSGKRTLYFPNITTTPNRLMDRYREAADCGADGVLVSAQLCGPAIMKELATIGELPVIAHPSFSGSMVVSHSQGIVAPLYFGTLWRAMGADFIIYPNAMGRFSFTVEQCMDINEHCRQNIEGIKSAFPVPGGGINRDTVPEWMNKYGRDTVFLIGGSLYQHPEGLQFAAAEFQQRLRNT